MTDKDELTIDKTANIAYSGQSGHYKQDTFVLLEQTFVFQTS